MMNPMIKWLDSKIIRHGQFHLSSFSVYDVFLYTVTTIYVNSDIYFELESRDSKSFEKRLSDLRAKTESA